ncbi:hypothetical protein [Thiorhodococcus mannitoliphagus]|nr:hypothetical protein [Thiorhodococcus mannitoliphagus]
MTTTTTASRLLRQLPVRNRPGMIGFARLPNAELNELNGKLFCTLKDWSTDLDQLVFEICQIMRLPKRGKLRNRIRV